MLKGPRPGTLFRSSSSNHHLLGETRLAIEDFLMDSKLGFRQEGRERFQFRREAIVVHAVALDPHRFCHCKLHVLASS